jgi:BirA family biotin operon repressor/biotin-[acetyl-CoA-carboxylase] ligase
VTASLDWGLASLRQALAPWLPGLRLEALAEVGSTNTLLLERLRAEAAPQLVVAEAQTAGRGRNGRAWQSAPGASLTFSLGLPFAPADWSGLSLAVGAALADAIEPQPARLMIKWPNDLWLDDGPAVAADRRWRKLGGILIETVAGGAAVRACVVGVGLNVQPRADVEGLSSGYACVQEIDAGLDAPALLARVAPALAAALRRFEQQGLAPFADAFARRDLLRGQAVQTTLAGAPLGVAEGVDASGALRLRHAGGVALVASGEVSVRPLPAGGPPRGA